MKKIIRKIVKNLIRFALKEELIKLQDTQNRMDKYLSSLNVKLERASLTQKTFEDLLSNFDCSVDVHVEKHSPSWAVISLQGQKSDYLKFIDLGDSDIRQIADFLRKFERKNNIKIDADPQMVNLIKTLRIEGKI